MLRHCKNASKHGTRPGRATAGIFYHERARLRHLPSRPPVHSPAAETSSSSCHKGCHFLLLMPQVMEQGLPASSCMAPAGLQALLNLLATTPADQDSSLKRTPAWSKSCAASATGEQGSSRIAIGGWQVSRSTMREEHGRWAALRGCWHDRNGVQPQYYRCVLRGNLRGRHSSFALHAVRPRCFNVLGWIVKSDARRGFWCCCLLLLPGPSSLASIPAGVFQAFHFLCWLGALNCRCGVRHSGATSHGVMP